MEKAVANILIIDDHGDNLVTLKALISDLFDGAEVYTATSGPEGIEIAKTHQPDVILLDILMPGMDGFSVCKIIKEDNNLCDIPVVFITALRENSADKVHALEVGAEGFLTKPFDENELVAVINTMLKIKRAGDFRKSEKLRLEKMVAERTDELQQELQLKMQLNERLTESEERFRTLFEKAPLGYQSLDGDGRIIEVNHMWLETLGYKREEVLGKWFGDFLTPEFIPAFRERFPRFKAAGKIHAEFEMLHKDGSKRWIAFDGRIGYELNGNFKQTHCILQDFTDRQQTEAALRESESKYRLLIENLNEGIWYIDENAHTTFVNQRMAEMLGYTVEEMSGKHLFEFMDEQGKAIAINKLESRRQGIREQHEFEFIRKDGSRIYVLLETAPIMDDEGRYAGAVAGVTDITERKQDEARLLSEKAWSESIINAAPDIIVGLDEGSRLMIFNKFAETLTGFRAEEVLGRPWIELFIPAEHRAEIYQVWDQIVANCLIDHQYENPIATRTGEQRLIRWDNTVLTENGRFKMVLSVGKDITEQKRAEEALRESEERFKALHNASFGGIAIHDKGIILECNLGLAEMTGYTVEELTSGFDGLLLISEKSRKEVRSNIQSGYEKPYEAIGLRKNGEEYPLRLEARNIPYKGKMVRTVEFRDITESKQSEEALRRSETYLANAANMAQIGYWELDIQTGIFTFSDSFYTLLHTTADEMGGYQMTIADYATRFVHPEDTPLVELETRKAIETDDPEFSRYLEHRIFYADGSEGHIAVKFFITKDNSGKTIRTFGVNQDITTRKKIELERQKFYLIAESSSEFIGMCDLDMQPVYVNPAGQKIVGLPDMAAACRVKVQDYFFPEDQQFIAEEFFPRVLKEGHGDIEIRLRNFRTGEAIWFYYYLFAVNDPHGNLIGWATVSRDITEHRLAENQLKLLNRAVESTSVSIVITDATGNIIYVNPFFTSLTGYTPEEARGQNPRILKSGIHPKEFYTDLWNQILSGKEWAGELCNKKKNGKQYWVKAVISPIIDKEGIITNFVSIKEDITDRKSMQEDLVKAKEKAEESDRLKSAFLANMSHEIRTPMNGILGFLELLGEPDVEETEKTRYTGIIKKSANRLLSTINDIIEISKIETGEIKIFAELIALKPFLAYYYDFFSPQASEKGLFLQFVQSKEAPETIFTDKGKLDSILTNLIKNAIKFSEHGRIEFGCKINDTKGLLFYVKDTGRGIEPDKINLIFERFRQADISLTRGYEGSGLGLSISKAYVEAMGGKLWVESEYGKGSCFYFTIPLNGTKNETAIKVLTNVPEEWSSHLPAMLRVLIADDDDSSFLYLDTILMPFRYTVARCFSGKEAVEFCRAHPETDLIFMDIKMPDMDGCEATRKIREFNNNVTVIAQTAFALSGDEQKALQAGCNDYIAKPFSKSGLLSLIQKYFSATFAS